MTQYPHLDLVIENTEDNTKVLRLAALVDTGYQGYVLINENTAKKLKLKRLKNITQTIKNASEDETKNKVAIAWVEFLSLEANSRFKIPVVIKEMQDGCVLGSKMLSKFAKDNQAHLVFNYLQDKIQFVSA
jgi:predicted aspartyl protease